MKIRTGNLPGQWRDDGPRAVLSNPLSGGPVEVRDVPRIHPPRMYCLHGHKWAENVILRPDGNRICKLCRDTAISRHRKVA